MKMKRHWGIGVFKFLLLVAIVLAGFGQAVLQLWNLLMPAIFGLPRLGFWQAVGLMALSWILFGGLRGFGMMRGRGHRGGDWRHGLRQRWAAMSPEEREEFRKGMRAACGEPGAPRGEPA
jgi:hypothetical protein